MTLLNADGSPAAPVRWRPHSVCDVLDGNNAQPGAMAALTNLIPDPTTMDSWVCRPASVVKTTFGSFTTPGFISAELVVGDIAYGMIATGRNAGKDEPFAYNIATNTFLTVTGILNANTPTSPATTGDWTPPIMAQVAQRIIVTHPGFPGGATKFGWFDVSGFSSATITGSTHGTTTIDTLSANALQAGWQPGDTITDASGDIPANTTIVSIASNGLSIVISNAATGSHGADLLTVAGGTTSSPLWGAGDTNINNLPSVPVGVCQFFGRAYFACGINGIPFSDVLLPCNRTNATQALTTNDGLAVTAVAPLQLSSPIVGGIVQSVIVFEGVSKMQQITGDSTLNNLSMNVLPVATGTFAPGAITNTNKGLAFISPDGLRFVDFSANVTNPVGEAGTGVTTAFTFAQNPSRMNAAASVDALRISVKRGDIAGNPTQEFWYDLTRQIWSGPHTFPADQIQLWRNTFLMVPTGVTNSLWQSDALQSLSSTFTENSVVLSYTWQTSLMPDDEEMSMASIVETTLMIAPGAATVNVVAIDDGGAVLDTVTIAAGVSGSLWDTATWDVSLWDGPTTAYRQHAISWHQPLVAKQFAFMVSGTSVTGERIGSLNLRFQKLGYQVAA